MPIRLEDFQYVPEHHLPVAFTVFRVQRATVRSATVVIGALKLAPPGLLASRFDLATKPVARGCRS